MCRHTVQIMFMQLTITGCDRQLHKHIMFMQLTITACDTALTSMTIFTALSREPSRRVGDGESRYWPVRSSVYGPLFRPFNTLCEF